MMVRFKGDIGSFEKNWQNREEKYYSHWRKGTPQNQIQFAFANHWEVVNQLMNNKLFNSGKRCLEVGCGRGTISAYFSDAGYLCTLIDISSAVIETARRNFENNGLKAEFKTGDANRLPFGDDVFDIVISIGLLEHFEDIEPPIREQIRVLDKGGLFIGYIVPEYSDNIQTKYNWINEILKGYVKNSEKMVSKKEVFRNNIPFKSYIKIMKRYGLKGVRASGIYPLPMISHSIEFPFTLMGEESEMAVVAYFKKILAERKQRTNSHPWLCKQGYGQAFLVWGYR